MVFGPDSIVGAEIMRTSRKDGVDTLSTRILFGTEQRENEMVDAQDPSPENSSRPPNGPTRA